MLLIFRALGAQENLELINGMKVGRDSRIRELSYEPFRTNIEPRSFSEVVQCLAELPVFVGPLSCRGVFFATIVSATCPPLEAVDERYCS